MGVSNILLGAPNRMIAGVGLVGGSWRAALPLINLLDTQVTKVARSTNAAAINTKFDIDMGQVRALRACALVNHNLSQAAQWRLTLGTTAGASDIYDTGFVNAWRMVFDNETLAWESASWWAGIAGDEFLGAPFAAIIALPDWYTVRYARIEIVDTANVAGYVQVGRVFLGNAFEPVVNPSYGLKDSYEDLSTSTRSESGTRWFTQRRRLRSVQMVMEGLSLSEAQVVHELMRRDGTSGEVLYVPLPSDAAATQRYGFLGRLVELSALDYPHYNRRALPLLLQEIG